MRGRRDSTSASGAPPLAGGSPGAELMRCASPCGNSTTSPATRRSGGSPGISTKHSPSVIRWKMTTRSACGSSSGAARSARGDW